METTRQLHLPGRRSALAGPTLLLWAMTCLMTVAPLAANDTSGGDPQAGLDTSSAAGVDTFRIDGENPRKGHYRVWGSEIIPVRAQVLLEALVDSPAWCTSGCRFEVPSIVRTDILPGSTADRFTTWTKIKDVLSGSYFSYNTVEMNGDRRIFRFFTPPAEDLPQLVSKEHKDDPFFHRQDGTWVLIELYDEHGDFRATRVEMEMIMESKKFYINLLAGRVIEGSIEHMTRKFEHLRAFAGDADPSGKAAQ